MNNSRCRALLQGTKAEEIVGQDLQVKFLEVDESRSRIVFTARKPRSNSSIVSGMNVRTLWLLLNCAS